MSGLNNPNDFDEDASKGEPKKRLKGFDCPECSAHNPYDDGFGEGDEVRCYYCGLEFKVTESDGKFKYREV
jgi:DNA-directed RNA polymerase subunit RPC12/RpoP